MTPQLMAIGQTDIGQAFELPLEIVTQAVGILAKRRAGKSYTTAKLVEQLFQARQQVVVVDPKGDWWGLRSSADGKRAGLPVLILGGGHGDLPLESGAGELVAHLVVEDGVSLVLDLSAFRKHQVATFMAEFLENLYRLKAEERYRTPVMLVIDEADAIAPQRPQKGEERMLGAAEDIVRRGGQRGLGCTMVTQRASVLNKNVLTQIEVLVVLRTIAPQDLNAVEDWVNVHGTPEQKRELLGSLPSLPVGTAWFWSPGWPTDEGIFERVKVGQRETYDSQATPKPGQRRESPRTLADVDIARLGKRMTETIERARQNDPRELRKRVAELEGQLERQVQTVKIERVEIPVISDEQVAEIKALIEGALRLGTQLTTLAGEIGEAMRRVGSSANGISRTETIAARAAQSVARPRLTTVVPAKGEGEVQLRAGERKILQTLGRRYPMKVTRAQLGTLAGFTPSGGTFGTYFGTLKRTGLIEENGVGVQITEAGMTYLGYGSDRPAPPTTEQVLEMWREVLRAGERKMLDELVAIYPQALSRSELGARTGFTPSGGTFGTYLGSLRRNGLLEVAGEQVRASETLFLEG